MEVEWDEPCLHRKERGKIDAMLSRVNCIVLLTLLDFNMVQSVF